MHFRIEPAAAFAVALSPFQRVNRWALSPLLSSSSCSCSFPFRFLDRRSLAIAPLSLDRLHSTQIQLSHLAAHAGAALSRWSLVFDPCPLQAEYSLHPFVLGYPSGLLSRCSLDLWAKTFTTDRWDRALQGARAKVRSTSQGHVGRSKPLRHACRRSQSDPQKPAVDRSQANDP